jgi:hypothetical protein
MHIIPLATALFYSVPFEGLQGGPFANASAAVAYRKLAAASGAMQKEIAFARLLEGKFGFGLVGTA